MLASYSQQVNRCEDNKLSSFPRDLYSLLVALQVITDGYYRNSQGCCGTGCQAVFERKVTGCVSPTMASLIAPSEGYLASLLSQIRLWFLSNQIRDHYVIIFIVGFLKIVMNLMSTDGLLIYFCHFLKDLRKQARQLENELDLKLVSFSKLCTSYSHSSARDGGRDRYRYCQIRMP